MNQDFINSLFGAISSLFVLNHIRILYKDKEVKGVSVLSCGFFVLWGFWNLYYYPFLGQWWSFFTGVAVTASNSAYVVMLMYYKFKK